MRILGIDYGDKNVGVAVSDPMGWTAQGLCVLRREDANAYKKTIAEIKALVDEYGVSEIVLGYPKNMDNTEGVSCKKVLLFKERLEQRIRGIEVILRDERLSTVYALRLLDEADMDWKRKVGVVDKIAATFILQEYLDMISRREKDLMNDKFEENNSDELDDDLDVEMETVVLTDEDGEEFECVVIDSVDHSGSTYLLVVDIDDIDDEEADANILKEIKDDDDTYCYEFIEDDAEFEKISKLFGKENDDYDLK